MEPQTQTLSSPNRANCNSPEFEFWMLRNPSFPQPNLLSADELFVDGVLLPLHLLPNKPDPPIHPEPGPPQPSASITDSSSSSKRWRDIFKKSDKKNVEHNDEKEKTKKKERKSASGATSSAELNINIWPFSRSRSAGNAATRPKLFSGAPAARKVNSAPCSRSNSAGESKSRKWPTSPARSGLHVGRSSPVWQVRRKNSDPPQKPKTRSGKVASGGGGTARVLNLNVPMCIGYRHHLSCRSDENSAVGLTTATATTNDVRGGNNTTNSDSESNDGGSGGNIFNLRNLFTKKCVVTSH